MKKLRTILSDIASRNYTTKERISIMLIAFTLFACITVCVACDIIEFSTDRWVRILI